MISRKAEISTHATCICYIHSNMALYQTLFNVYGHIFIVKVFGGCQLAAGGAATRGDWIF